MSSTIWLCCVLFALSANLLDASVQFAANCAPRLTVTRVEHYPYFVLLHRCDGNCYSHPSVQKCSATTYDEVKVPVFDLNNGSGRREIPMQNHTSCGCGCVKTAMDCHTVLEKWLDNQCRCQCKYSNAPPKDFACKPGFKWDSTSCRCECDTPPKICPPRKAWNTESCGCVCSKRIVNRCARKEKGLDHEKCECVDVQALRRDNIASVNSKTFITVIALLALLILVMLFVIVHFSLKTRRSRHHAITYPCEEAPSPKTSPSRSDSGNISYSNGSVVGDAVPSPNHKAASYQTDSNGSVCLAATVNRESSL